MAVEYQQSLEELLEKLSFDLELPDSWDDFFEKSGLVPCSPQDRRRFPRRYFRERAVMRLEQSLPQFPRERSGFGVYTKDLSRRGLSFLHHQQIFPEEKLELWTSLGKLRLTAVRCRKINDLCYEIGTTIHDEDTDLVLPGTRCEADDEG